MFYTWQVVPFSVFVSQCVDRGERIVSQGHPKVEAKNKPGPVFPESGRSTRSSDGRGRITLECLSTYDPLP